MSLVSNENKNMLWEVINNYNPIKNLNNKDRKRIMRFFDGRCKHYHKHRFSLHKNENELNKLILLDVRNKIDDFINQKNVNPNNIENIYQKKSSDFEMKLKQQQNEFSQMMNGHIPDEIDFSDNKEDLVIDNMDYLMNQTMSERENELKRITQKYATDPKALKWINNESTDNNVVKLEIKGEVENNDIQEIPRRKVSFNLENNINDNNIKNFNNNEKLNNDFQQINNFQDNSDILNEISDMINDKFKNIEENLLNSKVVSQEINNQKLDKFSSEVLSTLDTLITNQKIILQLLKKDDENNSIFKNTS